MATIQPTTSITIDEHVYQVSELSADIQQMVQYFDQWRQDEVDQASQLLKTRAALRDIQNTLLQQIQAETAAPAEDEPSLVDEIVDSIDNLVEQITE